MKCQLQFISFFALISLSNAQIWREGINSTLQLCSSGCSVQGGGDEACWTNTRQFYDETLLTYLRRYISVQINIDQWHRRHGEPQGQDYTKLANAIKASFLAQRTSNDILTVEAVTKVSDTVNARIKDLATSSLSSVPHFQCPATCDRQYNSAMTLFIISIALNVVLLSSFPTFLLSLQLSRGKVSSHVGE